MKGIILAVLLLFAVPTFACDINNSGLSKEAVATLKVACEQAKLDEVKQNSIGSYVTPDRISAIGNVSNDIAMAIGTAAKQVGIAANEFLQTPAGLLVAFGIFMKLFLHQAIGLTGLVIILGAWSWFIRRVLVDQYTVVEKVRFWGLYTTSKRVPTYTTFKNLDDSQAIGIIMSTVFTGLVSWALIGTLLY